MSLFLVIFFAIYLGLHVLFYALVRFLLPPGLAPRLVLWFFFALMITAPALSALAGASGLTPIARLLSWSGYLWMGYLIMALMCLGVLALIHLAIWPLHWLWPGFSWPWCARAPLALALAAAFLITAYAGWSATQVREQRLSFPAAKLPAGVERLVIAQTSDLHLGMAGGVGRLQRALTVLNAARPDIWIDTGDTWDRPLLDAPRLVAMMRAMQPPLGKFAVFGNHEEYVGLHTSLGLYEAAGFKVLMNQWVAPKGALNIAGVLSSREVVPAWDQKALAGLDPRLYTLFLRHRPLANPEILGRFELQLSGHVHGGQVYPMHHLTRLIYPLFQGLYDLGKGSRLYVTRGTGTWGPPLRLLAPPEVAVIELVRPDAPSGRGGR
ncbi:MAG: metallophosphoesterase [Desulfarculus sp.]|nr:MAG: metallophosphoesterase [Desulfarculus sp.]